MLKPTLAPRLTAVTIEPGKVRGALFQGRRVVRWHSVAVPDEALRGVQVQDAAALARSLRELLRAGQLPPSPLVVGLPASGAFARVLRLPRVPAALVDEAAQRIARQELPVPLDQLRLVWKELGRGDGQLQLLVVAVPKGLLEGVNAALRLAGIKPRALDLNLLASARLAASPDAVVVHVERTAVALLVLRNGLPELLRSFTSLDPALAPEALARIGEEVARTLQFQQSLGEGDHSRQPVVLAGAGPARDAVIAAVPEGALATDTLGPFACPPLFPRGEFLPHLGLAASWGRPRRSAVLPALDLLPRRVREPLAPRRALLVGGAALLVALLIPLHSARLQAEEQAATVEKQLAGFSAAAARRRADLKEVQQAKEQITALKRHLDELYRERAVLQGRQTDHAALLGAALQRFPAGGLLTTVKLERDVLALGGTLPHMDDVLGYREALDTSGAFGSVVIRELVVAGPPAPVRFSLEATRR